MFIIIIYLSGYDDVIIFVGYFSVSAFIYFYVCMLMRWAELISVKRSIGVCLSSSVTC